MRGYCYSVLFSSPHYYHHTIHIYVTQPSLLLRLYLCWIFFQIVEYVLIVMYFWIAPSIHQHIIYLSVLIILIFTIIVFMFVFIFVSVTALNHRHSLHRVPSTIYVTVYGNNTTSTSNVTLVHFIVLIHNNNHNFLQKCAIFKLPNRSGSSHQPLHRGGVRIIDSNQTSSP